MSIENRSTTEHLALLPEFSPSTYEEWRNAAKTLLKGASFDKKLLTATYEGITLQPIYMAQDTDNLQHRAMLPGFAPYLRGISSSGNKLTGWEIAQECRDGFPEHCNITLRDALQKGQTTVSCHLDRAGCWGRDPEQSDSLEVGRTGVSIATVHDVQTVFDEIDLETLPIQAHTGAAALPFIALLCAYHQQQGGSLQKLHGCIGMDPLGMLSREGTLPYPLSTAYDVLATATGWAQQQVPHLKTILIEGTPYHEGGGSAVQELAFVLATGVEYLRELNARELPVDAVASHMQFTFTTGPEFFMEIAKLRAARVLWAKVIKACGGNADSQKMHAHIRTSLRGKTLLDPYVNMLRATIEAFAGIVGGCESLHVGRFDEVFREPQALDEFSGRIARNTQSILKDESHLHEVIDPVGGSWYVEHLTDEVARKAWGLFQQIEQQGGMANALQAGLPQSLVAETALQRRLNLATRKDVLVGTNLYANLEDSTLAATRPEAETIYQARLEAVQQFKANRQWTGIPSAAKERTAAMDTLMAAAAQGATLGELMQLCCPVGGTRPHVTPVHFQRPAEIFEHLRAASAAYTAKTGVRPQVFMANMGPLKQHKARADFSQGFFEVAGFEMISNYGFHSVTEAAEAAIASRAPVVAICSTDDTYPDIVPSLTQKIKSANPETIVILAGYPEDHIETFKQAGINEFIHLRANVCDILSRIMKTLGIEM